MNKPKIEIEFSLFKHAEWAPNLPGQSFVWAYRVTSPTGNEVVGVCNGNKKTAKEKANAVADKMMNMMVFGHGRNGFKVTTTHQHRA